MEILDGRAGRKLSVPPPPAPAPASTLETEIVPDAGGHGGRRNSGSLVVLSYLPLPKPMGSGTQDGHRGAFREPWGPCPAPGADFHPEVQGNVSPTLGKDVQCWGKKRRDAER